MSNISMDLQTLKVVVGTVLTCVALFVAYLGYRRKSGLRLRGTYVTTATIECDDNFVSRVTLENLKDRAVTIFGIYLRLGYHAYVLVEEFGDHPLILKPFETYQQDYDPIEFYSVGSKRIRINTLLKDPNVRKRLMLSTSDGGYAVRRYLRTWDPVHTFFRNYMTAIIRPMRSIFKGKAYGSNTIFLVELKLGDGKEQVVPIYSGDHRIRRFRNVRLTQESLESKEALSALLNVEKEAGRLEAEFIRVHDLSAMRNERFEGYAEAPIDMPRAGAFRYYVTGWLLTRFSKWRMHRTSKKRAVHNRKTAAEGGKKDRSV